MSKGVSLKEALKKWAEAENVTAAEATEVKLIGMIPPIGKLDASLTTLANCEKLSLSTNMIDKLTNLNSLTKLKILSVGRNYLKSLNGVETLAETLEELWASYNLVEKLKPVGNLKKLRVFYFSNNNLKQINELANLTDLPNLEILVLKGCPVEAALGENYRSKVGEILPQVKKLDGTSLQSSEPAPE